MKTDANTILITGGGSGIGLAMAELFLNAGNEVLICGRTESKLRDAQMKFPRLHVRVCDVSNAEQRTELIHWAVSEFPKFNMLFNNAGIQKETNFLEGAPELFDDDNEIETNLTGVLQLTALAVPHFLRQERECAILNVTSGLAFIPLKIVPVYCATKAALHSFSMSLRLQFAKTNVRVFEIIPPIVQTDLHRGAKARGQSQRGISPHRVAQETFKALKNNKFEKSVGQGGVLQVASRLAPNFFHKLLNKLVSQRV